MVEDADGERSQRSMLDECTAGAMLVLQERCREAEERFKQEKSQRESMETELESLKECLDGINVTQTSILLDRQGEEDAQIEQLKSHLAELRQTEEQRKALEAELETLKQENESLKQMSETDKTHRESKAQELYDSQVENLRQIIRDRSDELETLKAQFDAEIASRDEQLTTMKAEIESQWKGAENNEQTIKILRDTLAKKEEVLEENNEQAERVANDFRAVETRCQEMEDEWQAAEQRAADMEEELAKTSEARAQAENEKNSVSLS